MTQQEALSFLLTYLVVEKKLTVKLDQMSLFKLTTMANEAHELIEDQENAIPHEIVESLAEEYIRENKLVVDSK